MKRSIFTLFLNFISLCIVAEISAEEMQTTSKKRALIFGVTGQDGAYLSEFLLNKGYEVHGVKRPASLPNTSRIDPIIDEFNTSNHQFVLHYGDLTDSISIIKLIKAIQPDEIYNLGAQSHVQISFDLPEYTAEVDALGPLRILEAIKLLGLSKKTKYYQASTSELFGLVQETPQTEKTPFYPRSPYAAAKLFSYWITVNYREAYGIYACNGILFNHESPLRGENFVTRKITLAANRYKEKKQGILYLGNLESKRDWGYAKDYVEAIWLMMQQEKPDDYVIATGETHSVREFVELAFKEVGVEIEWQGEGIEEYGIDKNTKEIIVKIDPKFYRPNEVDFLLGHPVKAEKLLQWTPNTKFHELLKIMIESDSNHIKNHRT